MCDATSICLFVIVFHHEQLADEMFDQQLVDQGKRPNFDSYLKDAGGRGDCMRALSNPVLGPG